MARIAVVTGANKGLGFSVVKQLCQQRPDWIVYLTARSEERGKAAVSKLEALGLKPRFHKLDVDSIESIQNLRDHLKTQHGGLDVLVNNAAIYPSESSSSLGDQARVTIRTNYAGTLEICKELFPLLRDHARVVNVSSRMGHGAFNRLSPQLKQAFGKCETIEQVDKLMADFVKTANEGRLESAGWSTSAYGMSKIGLTTASYIQQRMFDADKSRKDVVVNACCPGYCDTDMTNHNGPRPVDEGADTLVYLALLAENVSEPRGRFVNERKINDMF